jgi:UDP-3-O-[3-hydroxymyristoyl] N-acetylglucosamine deacetylase/3-hydroxyacyl-[acyl-carrier-protein] dehydratase
MKVDGPEFPILEGSAKLYVENILRVGIVEQDAEKEYFVVTEPIEYRDENGVSIVKIEPAEEFSVSVLVSFDQSAISDQHADLMHMEDFPTEIAPSRTFVFVRDVEPLLAAGLIKGGDLDNSIVLYERELPQDRYDRIADAMKVPRMDAKKLGYINHRPLVWDNEPARHKLLDVIGDMSLIGRPIKGHITGIRPGHRVNNQFARMLRKLMK